MSEWLGLARVRYRTDSNSAEAAGFDHSSAVFSWFGIVVAVFPWIVVPALFAKPWQTVLLGTLGAATMLALVMLPLRYRVSVLANKVVLVRSWAGITYKRVEVPNEPELKFEVWGTGDWGEKGTWPAEHYCEVVSYWQSDLMVGTPGTAEELAAWLTSQARRVAVP